jgi:ornithine decarboxylase
LVDDLEVPTPFVLIDTCQLDRSLEVFRRNLPEVKLHFAMKANSSPVVLKHFISRGLSFDAASAHEVSTLANLGVQGCSTILSHPMKDFQTVRSMLDHRVAAFAVDSFDEIDKIAMLRSDFSPEVFVRIRTESKDVQTDLNEKFGCRLADAADILHHAQQNGFTPRGVTFHVGTQSYTPENYKVGIEHALLVARLAKSKFGIAISTVNIGGGFCDEEYAKAHGTSCESLMSALSTSVNTARSLGFSVVAEPGRALVAAAGTLVCRVIGINRRASVPLVHIDDGVYGVLSAHTYEQRKYSFTPLARNPNLEALSLESTPARICGRTCDSLDILAGLHRLPLNLRVGDVLTVENTGAYGTVNASGFNGFGTAPSIGFAYDDKQVRILFTDGDAGNEFEAVPEPLAA